MGKWDSELLEMLLDKPEEILIADFFIPRSPHPYIYRALDLSHGPESISGQVISVSVYVALEFGVTLFLSLSSLSYKIYIMSGKK